MAHPAPSLRSSLVAAGLIATAAFVALAPQKAAAEPYDIDCKLILCLPAGFPSGCLDAYRHMVDRLRDGKSPIGFCAMSDGTEYDAYDIDYAIIPAQSSEAWLCPPGKALYHQVQVRDEALCYRVSTFCYDRAYSYGADAPARYTGRTRPERVDFKARLTLEPGTPAAFTQGWQRFDADMATDWSTEIRFNP